MENPNLIEISDITDKGVDIFGALSERQLRVRHPDLFIAETPNVIMRALEAGCRPYALLCDKAHITDPIRRIIDLCPPGTPIYTADKATLGALRGVEVMRGVICALYRPDRPVLDDILRGARRVVVLDGVCDAANVGAIFRSAAALGADAVLVTDTTCDPLNRRAVRVSMGTVFQVNWGWIADPAVFRDYGFKTAALALKNDSVTLEDKCLLSEERLALVLGEEGYGLSADRIARADYTVCIPMCNGVDSLNVAATASIAIYALTR